MRSINEVTKKITEAMFGYFALGPMDSGVIYHNLLMNKGNEIMTCSEEELDEMIDYEIEIYYNG